MPKTMVTPWGYLDESKVYHEVQNEYKRYELINGCSPDANPHLAHELLMTAAERVAKGNDAINERIPVQWVMTQISRQERLNKEEKQTAAKLINMWYADMDFDRRTYKEDK